MTIRACDEKRKEIEKMMINKENYCKYYKNLVKKYQDSPYQELYQEMMGLVLGSEKELKLLNDDLFNLGECIKEQIDSIKNEAHKNLLIQHFIKGIPISQIAKEESYSESWVYRCLKKSLQESKENTSQQEVTSH